MVGGAGQGLFEGLFAVLFTVLFTVRHEPGRLTLMGVITTSRLVMAGLLLAGGVLAVLAGVLGSGDDPIDGAAEVLWLLGVVLGLFGAGAGGYSLVTGAPYWLRCVVSAGSAGLAAVVLTSVMPDLETGSTGAVVVGLLAALVGGAVYLGVRRTQEAASAEV